MCPAIVYEMLVSHSPPVFSHSPPTSFLTDYNPFHSCRHSRPLSIPKRAPPPRPCLVVRPGDSPPPPEDPASPSRLKKRVVFADDRGMSLTQIRVMTEPSSQPPHWSLRFLAEATRSLRAEPAAPAWRAAFAQPAADYVRFRRRLERARVSLENVIVREADAVGTVKVRNLAFAKEVWVRASADGWRTHEDALANHVPAQGAPGAVVVFDTFAFKFALPPRARRVEFCVGFRCEGREYWDSNGGENYAIEREAQKDEVQAKFDSWSEFASWTHLENNSPYW